MGHKHCQAVLAACTGWALTGDHARTQKAAFGFLPPGRRRATILQGAELARELRRTWRSVANKDVLSLALAAAGGAVVVLEPLPRSAP